MNENSGITNDGIWLFAILALMWGGGGLFGNRSGNYPPDYARQSDVVYTSAFNQLQSENNNIIENQQRLATELQQAIYNNSYNNLSEVKTLESNVAAGFAEQQKCCCETLRAIDGVNYNNAMNTAAINANTTAQVQKIADLITENKMETMQNEINALRLNQAMAGVVRYPNSITYGAGASPFCNNSYYNAL